LVGVWKGYHPKEEWYSMVNPKEHHNQLVANVEIVRK
jgi:hypothetical protein